MSHASDLVQDAELPTTFHETHTVHFYTETGQTAEERAVQREEHWQRQRYIGGGSYGNVWLEKCIQGRRDLELRAVKEITKTPQTSKRVDYARELEAISKFSHPKYERCFVKSFGWYESEDSIYIAMEYFEHGDLHHLLHLLPPLSERDAQRITFQVLEALEFMHANGFAHRDLKPGNMLVRSKPPDPWWIKLGDFGISKRAADNIAASSTVKGTLRYMAPELLEFVKAGPGTEASRAQAADMWALGEIAFQMLTKEPTFKSMNLLLMYVRSPKDFPSDTLRLHKVSQMGINFITSLMQPKPKDRVTATGALRAAWISSGQTQSRRTAPPVGAKLTSSNLTRPPRLGTSVSMPSGKWSTVSMGTAPIRPQRSISDFFSVKPSIPEPTFEFPIVTEPETTIEFPTTTVPGATIETQTAIAPEATVELPERTISEAVKTPPKASTPAVKPKPVIDRKETLPSTARYFTIKAGSELAIETSAAHGIWCCGQANSTRLSNVYSSTKLPVILFFSVNQSRQFCGVAQMKSVWTRKITTEHWESVGWDGGFYIEWLSFEPVEFDDVKHLLHKEEDGVSITRGRFTLPVCESTGREMMHRFGVAHLLNTPTSPSSEPVAEPAAVASQDLDDFNSLGTLGVSGLDLATQVHAVPRTVSDMELSFDDAEMLDRSQFTTTSFNSTTSKRGRDEETDDSDNDRRKRE